MSEHVIDTKRYQKLFVMTDRAIDAAARAEEARVQIKQQRAPKGHVFRYKVSEEDRVFGGTFAYFNNVDAWDAYRRLCVGKVAFSSRIIAPDSLRVLEPKYNHVWLPLLEVGRTLPWKEYVAFTSDPFAALGEKSLEQVGVVTAAQALQEYNANPRAVLDPNAIVR